MKVVVVVPTYNEGQNIGPLLDALNLEFTGIGKHTFEVLIVDANSPDGTAQVVEQKKDVVVEMDADFQHRPEDLHLLIQGIDDGYDYVIGSRFIHGGSIPKGWSLSRKFLSFGGNFFSKIVLGMFSINDFTSGFKASRVKNFADQINYDTILSKGFAYKIDLLYRMYKLNAKIKEVPITFGIRDRGDSKMEKNNLVDSLRVVLQIRINENLSFFKFAAVGIVGLVADSGIFNVIRLISSNSAVSAGISGLFAMMVTFALNHIWSFSGSACRLSCGPS